MRELREIIDSNRERKKREMRESIGTNNNQREGKCGQKWRVRTYKAGILEKCVHCKDEKIKERNF